MTETRKITLGGRKFIIRPLTLDQLQELAEPLQRCNALTKDGIAAIRQTLSVALADQILQEELAALPVSLGDLHDAQKALGEVSGLLPLIDRLAAQYASRTTGSTSTERSAPTPDGSGASSGS